MHNFNFVGFDIGASSVKAVLVKNREVKNSRIQDLPGDMEGLLLALIKMYTELIKGLSSDDLGGVGFAVAGILDLEREEVLNSPNIKYLNNQPFKNLLEGRFRGHIVKIEHDAHCFLLAEKEIGLAAGFKSAFYLTLGSGIGGAWMVDGKIFAGAHGAAGEVAHTIVDIDGRLELEDIGASKFIKKTLSMSPSEAAKRWRSGDKAVEQCWLQLGKNLGVGVANIINIFDPEAIILSGGLSSMAGLLWPGIKKGIDEFVFSPAAKETEVLFSQLGRFGGAFGAALLLERRI